MHWIIGLIAWLLDWSVLIFIIVSITVRKLRRILPRPPGSTLNSPPTLAFPEIPNTILIVSTAKPPDPVIKATTPAPSSGHRRCDPQCPDQYLPGLDSGFHSGTSTNVSVHPLSFSVIIRLFPLPFPRTTTTAAAARGACPLFAGPVPVHALLHENSWHALCFTHWWKMRNYYYYYYFLL